MEVIIALLTIHTIINIVSMFNYLKEVKVIEKYHKTKESEEE